MVGKTWNETAAVAQRILIELGRRRRSLIFWVIFPVLILLLNGLILAERAQLSQADAFQAAAPPTLVGAALFFSCLGGSVATVVAEREQRTLKRLFISPLSGASYFLGIVLAHTAIGVGQTLVVFLLAALMGAQLTGLPWLGVVIILISIAAYVGVGFVLGTQFARRTEDVNALVAAFGVPLLILGGAFLPTSLFPDRLLALATLNPIYHMTEALAGALTEPVEWEAIAPHIIVLIGFAVFSIVAGWLSYRRMIWVERRL